MRGIVGALIIPPMLRIPALFPVATRTLLVGGVLCALRAPRAMADETWELGDAGWKQVAAPDPKTPAGQLQLLRCELLLAEGVAPASAAPANDAPAGAKPGRPMPDWFAQAWLRANPQADPRKLTAADLANQRQFSHSLLDPLNQGSVPAAGLGAMPPAGTADAAEVAEKVEAWLKANPNHELEAEARLLHGDALSAQKKFWKALYDYEFIARHFTATPTFTVALDRERRLAETFLAGWKRKFLGMHIIPTREEGVELLVRIQERVPGSALGENASKRLGDWYFETADMDMAVEAYGIFLQNYPDSRSESVVSRRIIAASLARFAGPQFDSTGLIEARQRLAEFKKRHPADAEKLGADALLVRIAESLALRDLYNAGWYERRGQWVSASVLYRRLAAAYPQTQAAREATLRLEALHQPLVDSRDPGSRAAAAGGKP